MPLDGVLSQGNELRVAASQRIGWCEARLAAENDIAINDAQIAAMAALEFPDAESDERALALADRDQAVRNLQGQLRRARLRYEQAVAGIASLDIRYPSDQLRLVQMQIELEAAQERARRQTMGGGAPIPL